MEALRHSNKPAEHKSGCFLKRCWTEDEDQQLAALVQRFGAKWSLVATHLPGRIGKQCKDRWMELGAKATSISEGSDKENDVEGSPITPPRTREPNVIRTFSERDIKAGVKPECARQIQVCEGAEKHTRSLQGCSAVPPAPLQQQQKLQHQKLLLQQRLQQQKRRQQQQQQQKQQPVAKRKYDEVADEGVPLTLSTLPPLLHTQTFAGKHSQLKVLFLAHKLKQAQTQVAQLKKAGQEVTGLPAEEEQQQVVTFLSRWMDTARKQGAAPLDSTGSTGSTGPSPLFHRRPMPLATPRSSPLATSQASPQSQPPRLSDLQPYGASRSDACNPATLPTPPHNAALPTSAAVAVPVAGEDAERRPAKRHKPTCTTPSTVTVASRSDAQSLLPLSSWSPATSLAPVPAC